MKRLLAPAVIALAATLTQTGCESVTNHKRIAVVQTNIDLTQRMTRLPDMRFGNAAPRGLPVIRVDDQVRYQRVNGAGVAITDSAAWLIHDKLPASVRAEVMANLFGDRGIHLMAARVPIGATDFTRDGTPYSYDELPPGRSDPALARFSVAHDDAYVVPTLRQALGINPRIDLIASPWSPPGWMKANGALGNHGNRGTLLPSAYEALAHYFVKFIRAYAARGIPVAAITPQNEPGQQTEYPGLNLPVPSQAAFVSRYLAPSLRRAGLTTKIYGHDFKWLFWRDVLALISAPGVSRTLAGIAWHCYDGNPNVMTMLHRISPRLDQIESECATGAAPGPPAELLIASFRHWASTVVLWSVALDPRGGPVQPPNYGCPNCSPVITVDARTHTITYRSDYYQLGQFGSFVEPGAWRIASNNFVTYNTPDRHHRMNYATYGLDDVAFVNPDGRKVLLVHNTARRQKLFAVDWHRQGFTYTLPAGATVTFAWS